MPALQITHKNSSSTRSGGMVGGVKRQHASCGHIAGSSSNSEEQTGTLRSLYSCKLALCRRSEASPWTSQTQKFCPCPSVDSRDQRQLVLNTRATPLETSEPSVPLFCIYIRYRPMKHQVGIISNFKLKTIKPLSSRFMEIR